MFTPKSAKTYEPQTDLQGEWLICTPDSVPGFSAVGYLFSRDLQREIKEPVGFLTLAFGASTAESWIRRETMAADPLLKPILEHFDAQVQFFRANPNAPPDQAPPPPQTINARPAGKQARQRDPVQDQHNPTVLFNGMIQPAIPYAIRGVIWYQGESIVGGKEGVAPLSSCDGDADQGLAQGLERRRFSVLRSAVAGIAEHQQQSACAGRAGRCAIAASCRDGCDDRHRRSQGRASAQ